MSQQSVTEWYQDDSGEWRWRKIVNNNVVADSGESYPNKEDAWNGYWSAQDVPTAKRPNLSEFSESGDGGSFSYYHYEDVGGSV